MAAPTNNSLCRPHMLVFVSRLNFNFVWVLLQKLVIMGFVIEAITVLILTNQHLFVVKA